VFFDLGSYVTCLSSNDYNDDGITDLASLSSSFRNVSIFLGSQSSGLLPSQLAFGLGEGSNHIVGGDFNNDGFKDIISTSSDECFSVLFNTGGVTGIETDDGKGSASLPKTFALGQNYPNPFNPSTTIQYTIPDVSGEVPVKIHVYNIRGRLVKQLVDKEMKPGRYQIQWNGLDSGGHPVSSGIYLYRIEAGDYNSIRKMVLVK